MEEPTGQGAGKGGPGPVRPCCRMSGPSNRSFFHLPDGRTQRRMLGPTLAIVGIGSDGVARGLDRVHGLGLPGVRESEHPWMFRRLPSPASVVIWFFVPFANLIVPLINLRNLWRGRRSHQPGETSELARELARRLDRDLLDLQHPRRTAGVFGIVLFGLDGSGFRMPTRSASSCSSCPASSRCSRTATPSRSSARSSNGNDISGAASAESRI